MNTAAARAERIPPAAVAADPARMGSAVLLATARAADGGAAALLPWGDTTLLGRLLGQLAGLGIASTHVIARPGDAEQVAAAVAGHEAVVHTSTGPAADLDVVAAIAAEGGGGLVVAAGDLVTQDEALAGLIADTRLPTGVLASISRTGYPFTQRMRLRGGRVISAASPYHTVRAPNAVFLDVLKVAGADRPALAAAAAQLHGLLRDGVPGEWEESFEGKIERWRGALARRARGLAPPDDPPPGEDAAPVELDDAAVLAGHEDEEPGDARTPGARPPAARGGGRAGRPRGVAARRRARAARLRPGPLRRPGPPAPPSRTRVGAAPHRDAARHGHRAGRGARRGRRAPSLRGQGQRRLLHHPFRQPVLAVHRPLGRAARAGRRTPSRCSRWRSASSPRRRSRRGSAPG